MNRSPVVQAGWARAIGLAESLSTQGLERAALVLSQAGFRQVEHSGARMTFADERELWLDLWDEPDGPRLEIWLDWYVPPDAFGGEEYENKIDEYFEKFEALTDVGSQLLGQPKFSDGAAVRGFPPDEDALWISLWDRNGVDFMV